MNPLMFADWSRLNRWFRNLMWWVAVLMALTILILATNNAPAHQTKQGNTQVVAPR